MDVEKDTKGLRSAAGARVPEARVLKTLQKAAQRLRKRAVTAASHGENDVCEIRTELESNPPANSGRAVSRSRVRLAAGPPR